MARPNQVRGAKRPAGPRIDAAIYLAIGCALAYFAATTDLRPHFPAALPAPAATKPFATFDEFYPFYLTQHSDVTCRYGRLASQALLNYILFYLLGNSGCIFLGGDSTLGSGSFFFAC
jgi:hypothetical protein